MVVATQWTIPSTSGADLIEYEKLPNDKKKITVGVLLILDRFCVEDKRERSEEERGS